MRTNLHEALIPFELTNGNDGRGNKWYSTAKTRKNFERLLRMLGMARQPYDKKVSLRVVRVLGPRQKLWDTDSVGRGNSKELIDSLVEIGWFHDDSPRWLDVSFGQDASRRNEGPAIQLIVFEDK